MNKNLILFFNIIKKYIMQEDLFNELYLKFSESIRLEKLGLEITEKYKEDIQDESKFFDIADEYTKNLTNWNIQYCEYQSNFFNYLKSININLDIYDKISNKFNEYIESKNDLIVKKSLIELLTK